MNDNCHVYPIQKTLTAEELETINKLSLEVWGMGCSNCAMRVRNSLIALKGVIDAHVDHTTGIADVDFNPNMILMVDLADAIANAGNGRHRYLIASVIERSNS